MPVTTKSRVRRRIVPISGPGTVHSGYIYNRGTTSSPWPSTPYQEKTYSWSANLSFIRAQACHDELHAGPPWREGGPLKMLDQFMVEPYELLGRNTHISDNGLWKWVGAHGPELNRFGMDGSTNFSETLSDSSAHYPSLSGQGPKAWKLLAPNLQQGDLFVTLKEMKDIPRMLQSTAKSWKTIYENAGGNKRSPTMAPGDVADGFLNHQFGWHPFIKDMIRINNVYHNSISYIWELTKRNNQWLKRKGILEESTVSERTNYGTFSGGSLPPQWQRWYRTEPTYTVLKETKVSITAAGRFKFYRPEFDKNLSEYNSQWAAIQRQLMLYGLRISPSNIYNATPWTWLIDWFVNVGDNIDVITDMLQDSILAKYLYVMEKRDVTRSIFQNYDWHDTGLETLVWKRGTVTKQRLGIDSPFGFGLTWSNMSPRQLAILVALGISGDKGNYGNN